MGHTFWGLQSAHCQGSPAVDLGPALRAGARGGAAGLGCPVSSQLRAALRVSGGPCRLSLATGWFCADPAAFSPCPQNTLSKHRVNCQLRLRSSEQSAVSPTGCHPRASDQGHPEPPGSSTKGTEALLATFQENRDTAGCLSPAHRGYRCIPSRVSALLEVCSAHRLWRPSPRLRSVAREHHSQDPLAGPQGSAGSEKSAGEEPVT